jgi:aspartate aminotransferase-like enzyme
MTYSGRDPILLTPGPLTTSLATKSAMLRDWGSWDAGFNAVTARVRARLAAVVNGEGTHVCVPLQGSGTFSVEAAVNTLVPRDGHLLVLINGAYGKRAITAMPNRHDRRTWREAVIRIGRETRSVSETWNVIPMVNATYAKSP